MLLASYNRRETGIDPDAEMREERRLACGKRRLPARRMAAFRLLEPTVDGSCHVLMRDIVFSSGNAVGHFMSGSKGFELSASTLPGL